MTLDRLKTLITDHDLTFTFADSGIEYERGNRESKAITRAFKTLSREDKIIIIDHWNETVSKKLKANVHDMFMWDKDWVLENYNE
tara:strand:+ start:374 stop:628 length:255 start_codon:yes stop_codon:yes gene_type:complete